MIQFVKSPKNNLLIYGPTPLQPQLWIRSTRINIGEITLAKSRRKIQLEIGTAKKHGGRLIGLGHSQGETKKAGHDQWFRMDWHDVHGNEDHISGDYHYHWNINKK